MVWICVNTFASTLDNESAFQVGSDANAAETVKPTKYRSITDDYQFEAMPILTTGINSKGTTNIFGKVGRRLTEAKGNQRETFWLMQKISLEVQ